MTEFIVFMAKFLSISFAVFAILASIFVKSDDYGSSDSKDDASIYTGLAGGAGVIFRYTAYHSYLSQSALKPIHYHLYSLFR